MKMIVMQRLSYFVIDDYKLMTIWQTMIMIVIADVELLCWWWQWWPTMKTRRTVPGQIVINVFSTNLLKREIRLNDNAKKKLKSEYWKLTRLNLNIILIKRAITKLIKIFIIISTDRTSQRHHPSYRNLHFDVDLVLKLILLRAPILRLLASVNNLLQFFTDQKLCISSSEIFLISLHYSLCIIIPV